MERMRQVTGRSRVAALVQALSFLLIGGAAFLIDAGTYNLLVFAGGAGPLVEAPVAAKIIAIVTASIATYVGNRFLTFRERRSRLTPARALAFVAINLLAIVLQVGCLAFSRYVLGLDSIIADNISGTVIGQVIAMAVRFVGYGRWVFPDDRVLEDPADVSAARAPRPAAPPG